MSVTRIEAMEPRSTDRILSFDIIRGWAIIGNLMVHTFMLASEIQGLAETDPGSLPGYGFIIMVLIVVFGHWRGLFLIISAAIHMYIMYRKHKRGVPRHVILFQEIIKGILLWLWALFFYTFLGQWGISKSWVETGTATLSWTRMYHTDQFTNIAFGIIVSAIVFYIVSAKEKMNKPITYTIIFSILGLLFIYLAPLLTELCDNFWGISFHNDEGKIGIGSKGWWDYIARYFAIQAIGRESPLFSHYAYSAVGSILGIFMVYRKPEKKKFLAWGYGLSGASIAFSMISLFAIEGFPYEDPFSFVHFHVHPTWFVFLTIGMLMIVVLSVMASLEFKENINWKHRLMISRHSRRVGVLSLTVYSLASVQSLLRVLLGTIFPGAGFRTNFGLNIWWILLLIALEVGVWIFIMWIWEKGRYIGSIDWLFTIILKGVKTKKHPEREPIFGDLLGVKNKIIRPNPVSWVEPVEPKDDENISNTEEIPIEVVGKLIED